MLVFRGESIAGLKAALESRDTSRARSLVFLRARRRREWRSGYGEEVSELAGGSSKVAVYSDVGVSTCGEFKVDGCTRM